MQKRILVPYGTAKQIAQEFGVSLQTVTHALHFARQTHLTISIRKAALERFNGIELDNNAKPCEQKDVPN